MPEWRLQMCMPVEREPVLSRRRLKKSVRCREPEEGSDEQFASTDDRYAPETEAMKVDMVGG